MKKIILALFFVFQFIFSNVFAEDLSIENNVLSTDSNPEIRVINPQPDNVILGKGVISDNVPDGCSCTCDGVSACANCVGRTCPKTCVECVYSNKNEPAIEPPPTVLDPSITPVPTPGPLQQ